MAQLGDRIVGTIRYSDYPPAALAIPRIGDSFALDAERILSLKPDLVIVWLHGNPQGQLEQLRRLGLPVFSSEPRRLGKRYVWGNSVFAAEAARTLMRTRH